MGTRLAHPTRCWWCHEPVFFYRDENGGCALFDHLGAPWEVHGCWQRHRETERVRAEAHYRRQAGQARPPLRQVEPSGGQTRVNVAGFVVRVAPEPVVFRGHPATRAGALAVVQVCDKHNRLFHLLIPEPGGRKIAAHDAVRAPAAWLRRAGTWHLFADTVHLDGGLDRLQLNLPGAPLTLPALCESCGDQVREDGEWGINPAHHLECPACSTLRGRLTPDEFSVHCAERAALRSVRGKPLPGKLPGTYTSETGSGPRIVLGADHTWRREGDTRPVGDFSYHHEVVRLYERGEIVHAFKMKKALNGLTLREVFLERSRGRRGAPALMLVRAAAQPAARPSRTAPKPPPPKPREKQAGGARALQMLQRRYERAHGRYEAIVAHELTLNSLFMLAGRRTDPAHWDRDASEIARIRAELADECRRLQSSCRQFRSIGTVLGMFARTDDSPLVRRFKVLEQNAARHPRPRGTIPARPAALPRPQPTAPAAVAPAASSNESRESVPSTPVAIPRPHHADASSDFAEKLRRALAMPGEPIRTENR